MSNAEYLLSRALESYDNGTANCDLVFEEIRSYFEEPEKKREPLSRDEIEVGFLRCDQWAMEGCFIDGVRFAEKYHGIGGGE